MPGFKTRMGISLTDTNLKLVLQNEPDDKKMPLILFLETLGTASEPAV